MLVDLVDFLAMRGFEARGFASAEAFFQAWPDERFDLLLLDVLLPGASGLEIAQKVRERESVGIVILTALDSNDDHVQGLDAGADVFLSKRSSLDVIEAACRSVLRRQDRHGDARVPGDEIRWRLNSRSWLLESPGGCVIELTHSETLLLAALFKQPGEAVAREELLACMGKPATLSNLRNLDNTSSRVRRKVQEICGIELPVRPSYGKGYTFAGECEVCK